jgi:hypothetical protein
MTPQYRGMLYGAAAALMAACGCWGSTPPVGDSGPPEADGDTVDDVVEVPDEDVSEDGEGTDNDADAPEYPPCPTLVAAPPTDLGPVAGRGVVEFLAPGSTGWLAVSAGHLPGTQTLGPGGNPGGNETTLQTFALDPDLTHPGDPYSPSYCGPIVTPSDTRWCEGIGVNHEMSDTQAVSFGRDSYAVAFTRHTSPSGGPDGIQRFLSTGEPVGDFVELVAPDGAACRSISDHGYPLASSGANVITIMRCWPGSEVPSYPFPQWDLYVPTFDPMLNPGPVFGPTGSPPLPQFSDQGGVVWSADRYLAQMRAWTAREDPLPCGLLDLGIGGEGTHFTGAGELPPGMTGDAVAAAPNLGSGLAGFLVPAPRTPVGIDPEWGVNGPNHALRYFLVRQDGRIIGPSGASIVGAMDWSVWDGSAFDVVVLRVVENRWGPAGSDAPWWCFAGDGPMVWELYRLGPELELLDGPMELERFQPSEDSAPDCDFLITRLVAGHGWVAYPHFRYDAASGEFRGGIGRLRCTGG